MKSPAGAQWCDLFPTSKTIDDLAEPFRGNVNRFIAELRSHAVLVSVAATYRPPQRAYLMHYCCLVAGYRDKASVFQQMNPIDVPEMPGVDIDWTCGGNVGAARAAAVEMRARYGIVYPAALKSRHTERLAIDMSMAWSADFSLRDATGNLVPIVGGPRNGGNKDLAVVGGTYGVIKLPSDPPHWSNDGH